MTTYNVIIRGQSNADLLGQDGATATIASDVENILGSGTTVNVYDVAIGGGSTVTSATAIDGTSFLPSLYTSWLSSSGSGSYSEAYPEEIFQNFLSSGSIDFSYPTIILFMHNESDSTTSPGDLTASDFENAVAYEQSLVNSTAGTNIPYLVTAQPPF